MVASHQQVSQPHHVALTPLLQRPGGENTMKRGSGLGIRAGRSLSKYPQGQNRLGIGRWRWDPQAAGGQPAPPGLHRLQGNCCCVPGAPPVLTWRQQSCFSPFSPLSPSCCFQLSSLFPLCSPRGPTSAAPISALPSSGSLWSWLSSNKGSPPPAPLLTFSQVSPPCMSPPNP